MAQARLVPASPKQAAVADHLLERILAPAPLFPRDDEAAWSATYVRLMAERRAKLRAHVAVEKLLDGAEAPAVHRYLEDRTFLISSSFRSSLRTQTGSSK